MKNKLVLVAAGLLVFSSLTACGSGNTTSKQETTKAQETKAETIAESTVETSKTEEKGAGVETTTGKLTVGFDQ